MIGWIQSTVFIVLFPCLTFGVTVSGVVTIEGTPVSISNASLALHTPTTSYTTTSDTAGTFIINVPTGAYQLRVSANNYTPIVRMLSVTSSRNLMLETTLLNRVTAPQQRVVAARGHDGVSRHYIEQSDIKRLSQSTLFSDAMNAVKMMPSVASKGSFDSSIFIRGGNAYEVLGVLDDIPIYEPYLWGGRVSMFNAKTAEKIEFYPGGFPAKGGQSLSGVLDIYSKTGSYKEKKAFFDMNLTELNTYYARPVVADTSKVMLSFRRTYYDLIAPLFIKSDHGKVQMPYIASFQSIYSHQLSNNHTLRLAAYTFQDGLNMPESSFDDDKDETDSAFVTYKTDQIIGSAKLTSTFKKAVVNDALLALHYRAAAYSASSTRFDM